MCSSTKQPWIAECSFTEQVQSPDTRKEMSLHNDSMRAVLSKCGVPFVRLSHGTEQIPAVIGMRMRVASITKKSDGIHVRWRITFIPSVDALQRRMFSEGKKVRFKLQPLFMRALQELTEILEPRFLDGVVDVFYYLPPERIPLSWFVASEIEGLLLREKRALAHNLSIQSKWICLFVPRILLPTYLGTLRHVWKGAPVWKEFAGIPDDRWKQKETDDLINVNIVRELLTFPLDSLWRAVYTQPYPAQQLVKAGYQLGPADKTIFDADARLADVIAGHQKNLKNLGNFTFFG